MKHTTTAAILSAALTILLTGTVTAHGEGTCSELLDGRPHGYHIVADYVTGVGSEFLGGPGISWPPTDRNAAGGAALPGGPGPAFHGVLGVPPGASFCNEQAKSGGR
jgi:hypothetical protein